MADLAAVTCASRPSHRVTSRHNSSHVTCDGVTREILKSLKCLVRPVTCHIRHIVSCDKKYSGKTNSYVRHICHPPTGGVLAGRYATPPKENQA